MYKSVAFLLFATTALSFKLNTTPEQLQALLTEISNDLKSKENLAKFTNLQYYSASMYYISQTKIHIMENLTDAAQTYWNEISSLVEEAASNGKDISACVDSGNSEFFKLNNTILRDPNLKIQLIETEVEDLARNCSNTSRNIFELLSNLENRASECLDNTCAGELSLEAGEFHDRSLNIIVELGSYVREYTFTDLPNILANIHIDTDLYRNTYGQYLKDIKICIADL